MKNYNHIIFKGTIGRDARMAKAGDRSVANFSVATEYNIKGSDGNYITETTWLNVVAWEGYGVCPLGGLVKGARVAGSGRLRSRKFTDSQGEEREVYEVVVSDLDLISTENTAKKAPETANAPRGNNQYGSRDDMPF